MKTINATTETKPQPAAVMETVSALIQQAVIAKLKKVSKPTFIPDDAADQTIFTFSLALSKTLFAHLYRERTLKDFSSLPADVKVTSMEIQVDEHVKVVAVLSDRIPVGIDWINPEFQDALEESILYADTRIDNQQDTIKQLAEKNMKATQEFNQLKSLHDSTLKLNHKLLKNQKPAKKK